ARRSGVRALLAPEKHILELIHAGVYEKQRRVFRRNQRGAFNDSVVAVGEEFKESPANLIAGHEAVLFPLEWRPHRIRDEPTLEKAERHRGTGAEDAVSSHSF